MLLLRFSFIGGGGINYGMNQSKQKFIEVEMNILDYFVEVESDGKNGEFLINGKWYSPLFGCDTIQHIIDESVPAETLVRQKIAEVIDNIKLAQCGWEGNEDIVLLNDEPIGMTITKQRKEFDRWLPEFKAKLKEKLQKVIDSKFTA